MRNSTMMTMPPTIGGPPFPGYGPMPYMMPPPVMYQQPTLIPVYQKVEQKVEEKINFQAKWNSNIEHSTSCAFCQKKFFFKERVLLEKLKIEQASKKIEQEWNQTSTNQETASYSNVNAGYNNYASTNNQQLNNAYGNSYGNTYASNGNANGFNFDTNFVREKHTKSEIIEDDGNQNQFGYKLPANNYTPANNIEVQQGYAQRVEADYNDGQSDNSLGQSVNLK